MVILQNFILFLRKEITMKKFIYVAVFCLIQLGVNAQRVSKISISNTGIMESISVGLDANVILNISPTGDLINYGIEYFSERVANYSRVEPYTGRTEMYAATDDKAFAGKLKYIGRFAITYYSSYEDESLRGKIKSIGTFQINYYMPFDNELEKGKLKTIGGTTLTYYSSFENESVKGKLKSFGTTNISYYTSFDDSAFRGKLKNIGAVSFTYYPSYDRQSAGAMKTGNQIQNINGVYFVIR
jgi:hypothetical protein